MTNQLSVVVGVVAGVVIEVVARVVIGVVAGVVIEVVARVVVGVGVEPRLRLWKLDDVRV